MAVLVVFCVTAACGDVDRDAATEGSEESVSMLHVALQEGFDNDAVLVSVNDEPIFDSTGVTTDLRISRADVVEVPLREGLSEVTVTLPERNISGSFTVRSSDTVYLGVSVDGDSIAFTVSDQPFGYL